MRGSSRFQMPSSVSMAPSRISKLGRCGKKSLPTKKIRKTQSSIARSRSNGNGVSGTSSSISRYSRSVGTSRKMNGFFSGFFGASSFGRALPVQCAAMWPSWPHRWHPRFLASCAKTSSRSTLK